jgi:MFS family permease
VLLPAYLLALGYGTFEVGLLATVTMLGSAAATLAVGRWGHRFELRRLLIAAAALMALTGLAFAAFSSLWPLLLVAMVAPLNPGGGDVSVFYPLEHTALLRRRRPSHGPRLLRATASSARCSGRSARSSPAPRSGSRRAPALRRWRR